MTDENVNDENKDETTAEPGTTDAPEGVADVETVPDDAAPEETPEDAPADEPAAKAELVEEPAAKEQAADAEVDVAEPHPAEPTADAEGEPEPEEPEEVVVGEAAAVAATAKAKKKRLPRALRSPRSKPKRERPAERRAITRLPKPEHERGRRQERQGTVISAAADKTIVVRVDVMKVHPMYKKVVKRSTKLHAHDESNEAKVGDIVRLVETRPLSKLKRWRLQEVVEAAK
jgi:small subunit ribosomal protein S17